jgi:3'-phosphoadenosine 5'-phosphosulfate sulfotransferase (PAPS reductase)/FAD synthetase
MLKGRFPSRTAQFCTEKLKLEPINAITHPLLEAGSSIVSWIGEMAEESVRRAKKPAIERIRWPQPGGSLILYRPIHKWTKADNFALAKRHGILPNKLYQMGMGRVGCFCINQEKDEVAQWDKRFPEVIDRIRAWEAIVALVSRRQAATFFAPMLGSEPNNIDEVVAWSRTSRGGRQLSMIQSIARTEAAQKGLLCESAYGLCE